MVCSIFGIRGHPSYKLNQLEGNPKKTHMDPCEGISNDPLFDGTIYSFQRKIMKTYIMELVFDVWKSVVNGYKKLKYPPKYQTRKKEREQNSKAMNVILSGIAKA